jgi:hypothetical protein
MGNLQSNFKQMENIDEIENERDLRTLVNTSLKKTKFRQQMMVICSKACKNVINKLEWFIVPLEINNISIEENKKSLEHIQNDYDTRFMIFSGPKAYYYLIKFDGFNQLIFEYGRKPSPDLSDFENQFQPALILNNALKYSWHIDSFLTNIFENLDDYPANEQSMD